MWIYHRAVDDWVSEVGTTSDRKQKGYGTHVQYIDELLYT